MIYQNYIIVCLHVKIGSAEKAQCGAATIEDAERFDTVRSMVWSKWRDSASRRNLNRRDCSAISVGVAGLAIAVACYLPRLTRSGRFCLWQMPHWGIASFTPHRAARSFRLRKPPTRFPPMEVVGGFPRGHLVPNQRFGQFFRFLPEFAVSSRFCRFFPPVTRYFRVFPDSFKVDIWTFTSLL